MSDTLFRNIVMLQLIPRHPRKIDTLRLQRLLTREGYNITKRTIQRDLVKLSEHFPLINDERNKPYGWSWKGGDIIELPGMDNATALTCILAEKHLEQIMPTSVLKKIEPNIRRAKNQLKSLKTGLGSWQDKVRVLPRGLQLNPAYVEPKVVDTVHDALLEGKRFTGEYLPKDCKKVETYEVNPLAIVYRSNISYLVSTLWDYSDIKQLAIHRIKSAQILDKKTTVPNGFDLDTYINNGEFSYPKSNKAINLEILIDAYAGSHLYETPLSDNQVIIQSKDGRYKIRATVKDTQELRWWLLSMGEYVEVVSPVKLRKEIIASLETSLSNYSMRQ